MSHEFGNSPKKIYSRIERYNWLMKTVININTFDKNEIAKYRLQVINHYEQFGIESTLSAFPVKRSTLFLWKQKLKDSQGKLPSLIPKSRRPKQVRRMQVDTRIIEEIARLRQKHWRLGKQKLKPLIDQFCQKNNLGKISVSTIGKVIWRHKLFYQRPRIGVHNPQRKPQKKIKSRVKYAPKPGQGGYIQGDTIETWVHGVKRYTISFIDVKLKVSHSKTFTGKLARYSLDTFKEFQLTYPNIPIHTVQTDNGSEFEAEFDQYLEEETIQHLYSYPKCPKVNSVIERYNRSIQEEWMYTYLDEIDDVDQFNIRLEEYLHFYNHLRVHESLGLKTPISVINSLYP